VRAPRLPRVTRLAAAAAVASSVTVLALLPGTAHADTTTIPGELSTIAVNTTEMDIPVPRGVRVRAITGVLTMPEVVDDGLVTFRVNGHVAEIVEADLYQRVSIRVAPSDVVADGTIGLTMSSTTPQIAAGCRPNAGTATLRRIGLTYTGTEAAPTTLGGFFPPAAARVDVIVPADADDDMLEAGITAVAALSSRYRDDTQIELGTAAPPPADGTANQRIVVLAAGRPGEVTTAISSTAGVPTLTLHGVGDELTAAARALSAAGLGLGGDDSENLAQTLKGRSTELTQSLADLGASEISLSGYGTMTYLLDVPQDAFGTPVSELDLHLIGSHSAVAAPDRARLDVRMNGALVDSAVLDTDAALDLEAHVPAGRLRAVNELELTLSALAGDGSTCAARGAPAVDVDISTKDSTVTATRGTGKVAGFQLYPQVFEGTLPVALRPPGERRFDAAIDAARLVGALQRASAAPLEIQLIEPDAFLADDRSGLIVGATSSDSTTLEAPLAFSATRQVETSDSTFEVTSQQTYAALESIKQADRSVLMLGSWAPGNEAAPANISHKVTEAAAAQGWATLDGDLLIADAESPAFTAESGVSVAEATTEEERSYVTLFVLLIALVLLVIAFQVVTSIRRDRRVAKAQRDEDDAYAGADADGAHEAPADEVDDVDDLMEEPDQLAGLDEEAAASGGVRPESLPPRPRRGLKLSPRPEMAAEPAPHPPRPPEAEPAEPTVPAEPTEAADADQPMEPEAPAEPAPPIKRTRKRTPPKKPVEPPEDEPDGR
jgi:hypothetical protein